MQLAVYKLFVSMPVGKLCAENEFLKKALSIPGKEEMI